MKILSLLALSLFAMPALSYDVMQCQLRLTDKTAAITKENTVYISKVPNTYKLDFERGTYLSLRIVNNKVEASVSGEDIRIFKQEGLNFEVTNTIGSLDCESPKTVKNLFQFNREWAPLEVNSQVANTPNFAKSCYYGPVADAAAYLTSSLPAGSQVETNQRTIVVTVPESHCLNSVREQPCGQPATRTATYSLVNCLPTER